MGEGGVAGEGRVVGVPKFHCWGKCTMPLMTINSDWMSNASSGCELTYLLHPKMQLDPCNIIQYLHPKMRNKGPG